MSFVSSAFGTGEQLTTSGPIRNISERVPSAGRIHILLFPAFTQSVVALTRMLSYRSTKKR